MSIARFALYASAAAVGTVIGTVAGQKIAQKLAERRLKKALREIGDTIEEAVGQLGTSRAA